MNRKISSAFTEFYKVFGILVFLLFLPFVGLPFFNPFEMRFSPPWLVGLIINLFVTFYLWRMKDVEMTDAGLIITERFFFSQKTVFVPFEQIEEVRNESSWLKNERDIYVKFFEPNQFGEEIFFMSKGFWNADHIEILEDLKRAISRHEEEKQLAAKPRRLFN